jgi:uncharacterized membrane protein
MTAALQTTGEILMWTYWTVIMIVITVLLFWFALRLQDRALNRRDAQHRAALEKARETNDSHDRPAP